MSLDLRDLTAVGPALPEPFVKLQLEAHLAREKLLPRPADLADDWRFLRSKLRALGGEGGNRRVARHVLEPLAAVLGFASPVAAPPVQTREGTEDGGFLFECATPSSRLRAWPLETGTDLDAPNRRGRAFRYSPAKVASRVLLASGERLGLLTDGEELRLLICDPARPESHLQIRLDRAGGWRGAGEVPDSLRLLVALASPRGQPKLGELLEAARLAQTTVTKKLRLQARQAIERFVQSLLDHPENQTALAQRLHYDDPEFAKALWREGLVLVYRLLFVLSLEAHADPARAFSFAATSLWRQTFSPNAALGPIARKVLDEGKDTGRMLEDGLRQTFRMFAEGISTPEIKVSPLGGVLFGAASTPLIDGLRWGEQAVAHLLDRLLWTDERGGRQRVHYGALDVEELGRVYESLLELEPGIAPEPMARLRRAKLEVVVTADKADPYRGSASAPPAGDADGDDESDDLGDADEESEEAEDEAPKKGRGKGKTKVELIEDIPAGRFYLRVGLGRKSSGSYYTPDAFVRFLVHETLGPQLATVSPKDDPHPMAILDLKVLDPAMGSGHFLVAACRYLGEALYEACRACDDLAVIAEQAGDLARAKELRTRVEILPDPNDELMAYLPSRVAESDPEGLDPQARGVSQHKALALCRRLVAVHCLYGVDKNPLAVELAKLALWLESYAEGYPLTFMDHRLLCGDSLTGPFITDLMKTPGSGKPFAPLLADDIEQRLNGRLQAALSEVAILEASVGKDLADIQSKERAKAKLDADLEPFRVLARAWSGGVMLGAKACDDTGYEALARAVADDVALDAVLAARPDASLARMIEVGWESLAFELAFPEAFLTGGHESGFHVVLSNPPWEGIQPDRRQFTSEYVPLALSAPSRDIPEFHNKLVESDVIAADNWHALVSQLESLKRALLRLGRFLPKEDATRGSGAVVDYAFSFVDRCWACAKSNRGRIGLVLPNGFHTNLSGSLLRESLVRAKSLELVLGFSNRHKLFDISPGMRFDLVVSGGHQCVGRVRFGLEDPAVLFDLFGLTETFSLAEIRLRPPSYMIPEVRSQLDVVLWNISATQKDTFGSWGAERNSNIGEELHASKSSSLFHDTVEVDPRIPSWDQVWPVHEKGTIGPYTDLNQEFPRYCVVRSELVAAKRSLESARFYRLAHRAAIHAQEEMKSVFALLPPRIQVAHSAVVEKRPECYAVADALILLTIANSFPLNAIARPRVGLNLSAFVRAELPVPALTNHDNSLLAHSSLRLSANHEGYAALWQEQLGAEWREPKPRHTWPVLAGDAERWPVRAAIDAVVAHAYGLTRSQYEHILGTFSHKSYPDAPTLCLAAFDELTSLGLDAFCQKHDPYHDIPLVTSLPKPVIDYPAHLLAPSPTATADTSASPTKRPRPRAESTGQLQLLSPSPGPLFAATATPAEPPEPAPAPRGKAASPLDADLLGALIALLLERGTLTSTEAQRSLGRDAKALAPYFDHLVSTDQARKEGQARGTRYVARGG